MSGFREVIRDDPSVRRWIIVAMLLVTTGLSAWAVLMAVAAITWKLGIELAFVTVFLDQVLLSLGRLDGDLLSAFVTAFPIAVAAVCYRTHGATRVLNVFGNAVLFLAVIAMVAGIAALAILRSAPSGYVDGLGTPEIVSALTNSSEIAARSSIFYVAMLLGVGGRSEK